MWLFRRIHFFSARSGEKWLLLNNHTSLGRLGSAALVGSQSGRRITPNRNSRVSWTGVTCDQGSGPVLWISTGRRMLPPSASLPVMGEIAGVNTASLGGYLHCTKTRARWAEGFHELNGYVRGMGSARLYFAQDSPCDDNIQPYHTCLLYTSPSPRDEAASRMPSSA